MDRRTFLAVAAGATVGVAGCVGVAEDDYDVGMSVNAFEPETYTVSVGDEVVWHNTSSRSHTVTAYESAIPDDAAYFASGGFESEAAARAAWDGGGDDGQFRPGAEYSHRFEVAGTYEYVCLPHESRGMTGTIVVEEAPLVDEEQPVGQG